MDNPEAPTPQDQPKPLFEVRNNGNLIAIPLREDSSFDPEQVWTHIATTLNGGSKFDQERFARKAKEDMDSGEEIRPGGTYAMCVSKKRNPDGSETREVWVQTRNNYDDKDGIESINAAVFSALTPPEVEESE